MSSKSHRNAIIGRILKWHIIFLISHWIWGRPPHCNDEIAIWSSPASINIASRYDMGMIESLDLNITQLRCWSFLSYRHPCRHWMHPFHCHRSQSDDIIPNVAFERQGSYWGSRRYHTPNPRIWHIHIFPRRRRAVQELCEEESPESQWSPNKTFRIFWEYYLNMNIVTEVRVSGDLY